MQYKVPQNVGIEDRIVGPLTLRQLIILSVGCGSSYMLFLMASKLYELNIIETIVIALPALVSALAALVKINDITFTKFLLLFLEFTIKPKRRFWDHRAILDEIEPDLGAPASTVTVDPSFSDKDKQKNQLNLEELSRMLDSRGHSEGGSIENKDMDNVHDDYLVQQAFFGKRKAANATENMYWRCKDTHEARLKALAKTPATAVIKTPEAPPKAAQTPKPTPVTASVVQKNLPPVAALKPTSLPSPGPQRQSQRPPVKSSSAARSGVPTKPAPRHQHNKPAPGPVRQGNQVNTLHKNKPLHYIPRQNLPLKTVAPVAKNTPSPSAKSLQRLKNPLLGEISFSELQKGEIEINLD